MKILKRALLMLKFVEEGDKMFFEVNLSMNNSNSIVSAALLEAIWEENKKDVLDLLANFVKYIISCNYEKGNVLDEELICSEMKKKFGFSTMPNSVVICILKRLTTKEYKRILTKEKGKFKLSSDLTEDKEKFDNKFAETKSSTDKLIEAFIAKYNSTNLQKIAKDEVEKILVELLNDRGYDVLIEPQDLNDITTQKSNHKTFCFAQFIIEIISDESDQYYDVVTRIASGALLSNIVYIDTDIDDYKEKPLKDLNIYFDTSLLLFALGYKTEYQKNNMRCVIDMLVENGAHLYYFENNLNEVISIMYAYKFRDKNSTGQTLEFFDENNISGDTVDFYIQDLEASLSKINLERSDLFDYPRNASEYNYKIFEIIDEEKLAEHLKESIEKYTDEQVRNDVACIASVLRERKGHINEKLERCESIWITSNLNLIRKTAEFLNYPDKKVFPIKSIYDLSTEIWLKYGVVDKSIPKLRLFENAQMALNPSKALIEKYRSKIDILEKAGKIEPTVASIIRYDRTFAKNLALKVQGDEEAIDDSVVENEVISFVDKLTEGKESQNRQLTEEKQQLQVENKALIIEKKELEETKDALAEENVYLRKRIEQKNTKNKDNYKNTKAELYSKYRNNATIRTNKVKKCISYLLFVLCIIAGILIVAAETYLTVIGISKNNTIAIIITVLLCLSTVITEIAKCKTVFSTCKKHAEKYHQPLFDSFYKKELEKNKNELEIVEKMKTE